jgi:nucleoid-associated protein YgaU
VRAVETHGFRRPLGVSSRHMAGRSPARFLAPLALVAAAVALVLVVSSAPDDEQAVRPGSAVRSVGDGAAATPTRDGAPKRKLKKKYTVKPGDTPSGIAEKTGVPLEDILALNPTLDPQTLAPGTKIRLRK